MVKNFSVGQFFALSHELKALELTPRPTEWGDAKAWSMHVQAVIAFAEWQFQEYGFGDAAKQPMYAIKAELARFNSTQDYSIDIKPLLKLMLQSVDAELTKRRFAYVVEDRAQYFEQEQLLGKEIYEKFPSARFDLKEAGTALSCGLNSAAGFHLMRAAEIGLWELGRDRQIADVAKVESLEWGVIIKQLEDEVKKIQGWKNSPAKEEAHKFYNRAIVEIRAFNDGWRRHIAHVRKSQIPLDDTEAIALLGHVKRFLETLATKIAEGQYTPAEWI